MQDGLITRKVGFCPGAEAEGHERGRFGSHESGSGQLPTQFVISAGVEPEAKPQKAEARAQRAVSWVNRANTSVSGDLGGDAPC